AGLVERAELLETLLRDLYGPQSLVREGVIPAAVVAGSPGFLRPMVGGPEQEAPLVFYAADIGRGPDGRWWVLDDRSEAPSGAAYALQNRMAIEKSLASLFRRMRLHRLGCLFVAFRRQLAAPAGGRGT